MKEIGFTIYGSFYVDDDIELDDQGMADFVSDNIMLLSNGYFDVQEVEDHGIK